MSSNAQIIWNFLKKEGFSDCGAAGLMGNLDAESALKPNNLQNSYNTSLGLSNEEYTKRVDNGTYTNFVYDSAGYGLAQWTYWSRKQNLLNYIKSKGKSIGDLTSQLEFLVKELKENYTNSVYNVLKNATSIQEASNAVLFKFENPAVQNISVQNTSMVSVCSSTMVVQYLSSLMEAIALCIPYSKTLEHSRLRLRRLVSLPVHLLAVL